ncbi:MAG TPA: NAD(P)(+) transhydrogenase (Re/Si-specific) subunit beta [Thermomicrobiales bacterium]|nr:NAD(P)(+) transhydrogenase (Re/Si-specific) subunit beta [Thermomicrobiales bacterium]
MIDNWRDALVDGAYLITAVCFILGLRFLGNPTTARKGNQLGALGMAIAVIATLFSSDMEEGGSINWTNIGLIVLAVAIGGAVSSFMSRRVQMTAMPQMVAIFNGMGGATAALVSVAEFMHKEGIARGEVTSIVLGAIIGSISLTGSLIAFLKLQEMISGRPVTFPSQKAVNAGLGAGIAVLGVLIIYLQDGSTAKLLMWIMFAAALALGASIVLPIGGADMPVVIAILNSLTGIAAALTGLVLSNMAMVIAGALVGASGGYLTLLMAKAMNRSVPSIIFGAFGGGHEGAGAAAGTQEERPYKQTSPDDVAISLAYAQNVIVVPGYGLAVAQAQHAVRELADVLEDKGVNVKYAIHPVAGRMPGHMNVLLAEANVPYDQLHDMDDINDEFQNTDVVLVIGANDVTNPAAKNDPSSPIYGMPILNVEDARQIYVLKRSMKSGFAGIDNDLFYDPKTSMVFGDAKAVVAEMVSAVKAV